MKTTDFIKENKFIGDDAHAMHQDHEVQMARSDCYNAAKYAIELHKLLKNISEMEGLDGWVSEKITLANDYLRTVAEYLRHEAVMADQGLPEMFTAESAEAQFAQLLGEDQGVAEEQLNEIDAIQLQHLQKFSERVSQMTPADLEALNQYIMSVGLGGLGAVAGTIGAVSFGNMFMNVMRRTMNLAKKKTEVDAEEVIKLQRQIASIHKRLKTLKSEPAIAKYQNMLKQAYEVLDELEARQDNKVAEGIMDTVKQAFNDNVAAWPMGTSDEQFIKSWADDIRDRTGRDIPAEKLARLYQDYTRRSPDVMQSHGTTNEESGVTEARPDVMRHKGDKTVKVVKRGGVPIGEIGIDSEASPGNGQYYVKLYDGSYDAVGFDTAEEALAELKYAVKQGMAEGVTEAGAENNPVVNAITRRIIMQRTDLLSKYGLEKVSDAIDEVADFVGDVEEIGSSDVSGWVRHVEQMLGNMVDQSLAETTSAGGVATVPGVGGGPKVGSLFGGSYSPKTPFTGKKKAKESVIKR